MASRATKSLYDTDFAEWSARTAALIRSGRFNEIDAESVAEEIEDLGKSERSAAWSHLSRLLLHKIKQVLQPERDCASWWTCLILYRSKRLRCDHAAERSLFPKSSISSATLSASISLNRPDRISAAVRADHSAKSVS